MSDPTAPTDPPTDGERPADDPAAGDAAEAPPLETTTQILDTVAADVGWPDYEAENEASAALAAAAATGERLGRLQELAVWLSGVQGCWPLRPIIRPRAVVFAADHGIGSLGTPAGRPSTSRRAARIAAGTAPVDRAGERAGLDPAEVGIRLVDVGIDSDDAGPLRVRRGSGRADLGTALRADEVTRAVEVGIRIADEEIDAGADLLVVGDISSGGDLIAAAVISAVANVEPVKVLGYAGTRPDAEWILAMAAVRDARRFAAEHRYDVAELLAAAGGTDLAALTGLLLRAASRRTPVLLDGALAGAAALLARELCPRAVRWWQVGEASASTPQQTAVSELELRPLLDLGLDAGEGVGAVLALPLLHSAIRLTSPAP